VGTLLADIWHSLSLRELVALGVAAVAILNWLRDRRTYSLSWTLLADWQLFERDGWLTKDLVVAFNGQEIANPRIVLIKIENQGKHPVRKADYEQPLRIAFDPIIKPVYVQAASFTVPIDGLCRIEGNDVVAEPQMLNPSEWFVIRLLVDSSGKTKFKITGRLAGIVKFREQGIRVRDRIDYVVLGFLVAGVFTVLTLSGPILGQESVVLSAISGTFISGLYEFLRRMRYVRKNAQVGHLLRNEISTFWFTSRYF